MYSEELKWAFLGEKTSVPMYEDINCIFSMDLFSF